MDPSLASTAVVFASALALNVTNSSARLGVHNGGEILEALHKGAIERRVAEGDHVSFQKFHPMAAGSVDTAQGREDPLGGSETSHESIPRELLIRLHNQDVAVVFLPSLSASTNALAQVPQLGVWRPDGIEDVQGVAAGARDILLGISDQTPHPQMVAIL